LDPARLLEAMQRVVPAAHIQIIEYSHVRVPAGELEFSLAELSRTTPTSLWTGAVRYGHRRFLIWARVRIGVLAPRVVATEELKRGRPIMASQLRMETRQGPPRSGPGSTLESIIGRTPLHVIHAGEVIDPFWLDPIRDVMRGEQVKVEVRSGGALLE